MSSFKISRTGVDGWNVFETKRSWICPYICPLPQHPAAHLQIHFGFATISYYFNLARLYFMNFHDMVGMVKRMLWMTSARPLQLRRRYGKLGDMAFNRMEKAEKKCRVSS
jgi:hypothetical protein